VAQLILQSAASRRGRERRRLADDDPQVLLSQLRSGDARAFERLIETFEPMVRRLAHRLCGWKRDDVDDLVQEVFLAALKRIKSFRGQSSLRTWLCAITARQCRWHHRRKILRWRWLKNWRGREAPAADEEADRDETSQRVRAAVRALAQNDREVIVLFYLEELPVAQIAGILGLSGNAVDVRLHRARSRLKQSLTTWMKD
jgi:RNA polymerase sigma factor (sigma-70 family)